MYCWRFLLLCMKLREYPSAHVSRGDAAEWPPRGVNVPCAGPTKQSCGQQLQDGLPPGYPCCLAFVLPLFLTLFLTLASGSPRQHWRILGTTEDPFLPAFSRISTGGLLLWAGQKGSAAPATARMAWWQVKGSKAKTQLLQLLWSNHLLNYTGECAQSHIHIGSVTPAWIQTALRKGRSQLRAEFAYLHQPYQDMGTLGDWEAKVVSETGTVLTETFLKPHSFFHSSLYHDLY